MRYQNDKDKRDATKVFIRLQSVIRALERADKDYDKFEAEDSRVLESMRQTIIRIANKYK